MMSNEGMAGLVEHRESRALLVQRVQMAVELHLAPLESDGQFVGRVPRDHVLVRGEIAHGPFHDGRLAAAAADDRLEPPPRQALDLLGRRDDGAVEACRRENVSVVLVLAASVAAHREKRLSVDDKPVVAVEVHLAVRHLGNAGEHELLAVDGLAVPRVLHAGPDGLLTHCEALHTGLRGEEGVGDVVRREKDFLAGGVAQLEAEAA